MVKLIPNEKSIGPNTNTANSSRFGKMNRYGMTSRCRKRRRERGRGSAAIWAAIGYRTSTSGFSWMNLLPRSSMFLAVCSGDWPLSIILEVSSVMIVPTPDE